MYSKLYFLTSGCFQVIVVPIWKKADDKSGVLGAASSVKGTLQAAGIKVKVDDSEQRTPGWKFNFWEMKVNSCHHFVSWQSLQTRHHLANCSSNLFGCF